MKSYHVFLHNPVEQEKFVKSLSEVFKNTDLDKDWFFIRYWHGGPHVRVRFDESFNEDIIVNHLKEKMDMVFTDRDFNLKKEDYYKNHTFDGKKENIDELPFYKNGSIEKIEYVPEIERYGDGKLLKLNEKIFRASSEYVIEILNSTNHPYYIFLSAFKFMNDILKTVKDRKEFLKLYVMYWSTIGVDKRIKHDTLLKIYSKLEKFTLPEQAQVKYDNLMKAFSNLKKETDENTYTYFVSSQIHMNNNRFGIVPGIEVKLAKVLMED